MVNYLADRRGWPECKSGYDGHMAVVSEQEEERLAEPVVLEVTIEPDGFSAFEDEVVELEDVSVHEAEPSSVLLQASTWLTVVLSVTSAGGLKLVRDVLVAHIAARRANLTITRTKTRTSVTFEGTIRSQQEVERLVREITAEKPSG